MNVIRTVDLTKKFDKFVANDKINLTVKKNEIKCIVGENGAGKSTLMNMLYGVLQPSSGKIYINEKEVTFRLSKKELGFYLPDGNYTVEKGAFEIYIGKDCLAEKTFEVFIK